ncbi:SCO4402 family protein [Catenuloplanes indicus]|uniref:Uncharacterized protein n=1 Tax=Catenuloplanes indicus TaxID=137267 RepID=A0AAE4AVJ9_9ACTN|nr:hypothetical protein [Catenuloplanes indicus]MDQ0364024.1 hypothetical protein [Catenuloplanes indicus]
MTIVVLPGRRADIIDALSVLAKLRPHETGRWPGLTEAVHWIIDDTLWDQYHPRHDIGTILVSAAEAAAVSATLDHLMVVLDELGPMAADDDYLAHPRWHEVAHAAADAHRLMTGERQLPAT